MFVSVWKWLDGKLTFVKKPLRYKFLFSDFKSKVFFKLDGWLVGYQSCIPKLGDKKVCGIVGKIQYS